MRQLAFTLLALTLITGTAYANGEGPPAPLVQENSPLVTPLDFEPRTLLQNGEATVENDRRGSGHEILGVMFHPYAGMTLSRISKYSRSPEFSGGGEGDWSTGFKFGMEMDAGSLFVGLSGHLHDILSDTEVFPWNFTFELMVGGYM